MLTVIGSLLGGLGLFLLAVSMITDGLKLAAGEALRDILARSTSTRWRGVASGLLVTGLVQSSSAVTVATIGFVNAGLLSITQALGIVYGANIGTTMTGWLVAAIGFNFKIEAIALPLIGLGMAARLLGKNTRIGSLGEALAGFGLFFVGIDFLRQAFEGVSASLQVTDLTAGSGLGILLYVSFGFFATLITQSSSAAIALTLTAANGGVLAMDAAAAMVIGANVGTTSTAALSVIGATANAKRVAAAHVIFNVLTGLVALILLPALLAIVDLTGRTLGLAAVPAVSLALFHTVFNILGVAIMWGITDRLALFLNARFVTLAETLSRPQFLDRTIAVSPELAVDALFLELTRAAQITRQISVDAINRPDEELALDFEFRYQAVVSLTNAIEQFVSKVERDRLSADLAEQLPQLVRINSYLEEVANLANDIAAHRRDIKNLSIGTTGVHIADFMNKVRELIESTDSEAETFDAAALDTRYNQTREDWHTLKSALLDAATRGLLPISNLNIGLERLRASLRVAEQLIKASTRLRSVIDANPPAASDNQ
jgi:phosphate:Na+ symporter